MSISPLPASHGTMSLMVATNTAPARPTSDMGADNGPRQGREDDEQFVSALQAASSSKSADDATISEQDSSEGPKTRAKPEKAREEDSGRRAVLTQPWHTTMTGMPAPDAAGALALPASLLAHGQLALSGGAAGDINADAPPVAVVGIGVVTEQEGVVTGPVLNPATLALGAKGAGAPTGLTGPGGFAALAGLPGAAGQAGAAGQPGAAAPAGDAVPASPRAFGLPPSLTVVPAAEARPAVEAAITANADSAAAAASLAEVDLAALTDALHAGVPGAVAADDLAAGAAVPGGAAGAGAVPGVAGADAGAAGLAGAGAREAVPGAAQGAFDLAGLAGAASAVPVRGATERQLSPAELAATQATAAQNAAAQVAAVQATAAQLGQFLQGDVGAVGGTVTAAPVPAPGGPIPAPPPGLPGYVPGVAGPGAATTGDTGESTGGEGEKSFADTLAAADPSAVPVAPDTPAFTPLHTPDLSQPQQIDLTGANAPDQTPPPPPATQVADQIIPLRPQGDGVHRIAMELRPDDLGTVSVVAEIRNGQVHLHFGGANEMTREALRAALPDLRQQLEDAGFTGAAFDFADGSAAGQNDRRAFGGADQGSGGRPGQGGGAPGQQSGPETNQQAPRPGFAPPPTPGSGRHALDLQV